jgi:hypothetical protein
VSLDCHTPSVSSTAIEQVGWKERSQRHGVLVVGAENGNCPLYLDRLVMRRSYYIYVYVLKPKMQNSWSHLEVANVGTPLVSIVVSRAVAKGLCISSDFPDIVCSGIGFEPMKDCSGKSHDWVRCGSNHAPLLRSRLTGILALCENRERHVHSFSPKTCIRMKLDKYKLESTGAELCRCS